MLWMAKEHVFRCSGLLISVVHRTQAYSPVKWACSNSFKNQHIHLLLRSKQTLCTWKNKCLCETLGCCIYSASCGGQSTDEDDLHSVWACEWYVGLVSLAHWSSSCRKACIVARINRQAMDLPWPWRTSHSSIVCKYPNCQCSTATLVWIRSRHHVGGSLVVENMLVGETINIGRRGGNFPIWLIFTCLPWLHRQWIWSTGFFSTCTE